MFCSKYTRPSCSYGSLIYVFLFVSIGVFHFLCGLFVCQFMMSLFDMYHLYGITCSCTGSALRLIKWGYAMGRLCDIVSRLLTVTWWKRRCWSPALITLTMLDLCNNLKYYLYDYCQLIIFCIRIKYEVTASKQSYIYWFVSYSANW